MSEVKKPLHHVTSLLHARVSIKLDGSDCRHAFQDFAQEIAAEVFIEAFVASEAIVNTIARVVLDKYRDGTYVGAFCQPKSIVHYPSARGCTPAWADTQLDRGEARSLMGLQAGQEWSLGFEVSARENREDAEASGTVEVVCCFLANQPTDANDCQLLVETSVVSWFEIEHVAFLILVVVKEVCID
uniref:Uncharacterized protein n=1 Tax=Bionectria ochroleuca TaxID=29856 RepID=A0A8H7KF25_BIOOC